MSDVLIKGMEKPKACFRPLCRDFCYFHVTGWDGRGNYCQLTGNKVKCNKVDKDCPIVDYPTDFIRRLVDDLEKISAKVHELSQDYMSNELYDVHADLAECIESMKIVFGKEATDGN